MKGLEKIPMLPLRGMVVFPSMIIHLDAGRARSVGAVEQAMLLGRRILLVAQKNAEIEEPAPGDLFAVGTIAEVRQLFKLPGGALRVLVEGTCRAQVRQVNALEKYDEAEILPLHDQVTPSLEMEALTRGVVHRFEEWVKATRKIPAEALVSVAIIDDSGRLADLIASHLNLTVEDRQALLELIDDEAVMLINLDLLQAFGFDPALELFGENLDGGILLGGGVGLNEGPVPLLIQDVDRLAGAGDDADIVGTLLIRLREDADLFPLLALDNGDRGGKDFPDGFLIRGAHFQVPETVFVAAVVRAEVGGGHIEGVCRQEGIRRGKVDILFFHIKVFLCKGAQGKKDDKNKKQEAFQIAH